jgi:UDP-MurNAc hydroxylase
MHWLQFSGAIWYPMVYEEPREELLGLARAKVESQFARALKYVEVIGARAVVPSAGPPCFLDNDLFGNNMITGDELSIFPDQTEFINRMNASGNNAAVMNIPGTAIEISPTEVRVTHPVADDKVREPFENKAAYLQQYQADWAQWLADYKASWPTERTDLIATLQAWWGPLLAMAPLLRTAIGGGCVVNTDDLSIYIDFAGGAVVPFEGQPHKYRFTIARPLLEAVVASKAVDWSNSLFLSCRFSAWREGEYNEYLYNFFKSLSVERMRRAEQEVVRKNAPDTDVSDEIELGDYVMQRKCPHRQADLSEFGVIEGDYVVCTLHGWKFDVRDGKCKNAENKPLRIRKRTS